MKHLKNFENRNHFLRGQIWGISQIATQRIVFIYVHISTTPERDYEDKLMVAFLFTTG